MVGWGGDIGCPSTPLLPSLLFFEVTCICLHLLFPFISSWETLAWIAWRYVNSAWGIPWLFHRQAMKILLVTQMNCKDYNYQQKFLLWPVKNHKQEKGEWLTTVTLVIDRKPETWSVTYYVSFSSSVDLFSPLFISFCQLIPNSPTEFRMPI